MVNKTTTKLLEAILPVVDDLSRDMPDGERYIRLLGAVGRIFDCDACAVLRLDGQTLIPVAMDGLGADTLGRHFRLDAHPRFAAVMASPSPVRFPADSHLPDPYDGLVSGPEGQMRVHDCMGCALVVDGTPWGLLTVDALAAGRFRDAHLELLNTFAALTAAVVRAAQCMKGLECDAERARSDVESYKIASSASVRALMGRSPAFLSMLQELRLVGASDLAVLIQGETGVGKELVARALHAASSRADKPMIAINCAALPESLAESELFGHARGAFSGATADRRGKFELAHRGTLFLDEVAELPLALQAKLLRVMQSGQLQRVGSDHEHAVDVRIIAASNRDLAEEVRAGRCRADFYHRLSVYPLQVPPLRERGNDILLISGYFLEENRRRLGLAGLRLTSRAQAVLLAHPWPGNVRELEHLIARSALRALAVRTRGPGLLSLTDRDLGIPAPGPEHPVPDGAMAAGNIGLREALALYERQLIADALERNGNNWAAAARELGVDRANLSRSARRLGMK